MPLLHFRRWNRYGTRRARSSELREAPVGKKPANNEFDPKAFLARVGAGKTILKIKKNQHVFEHGDVAGMVFYIQKGRVKPTVLSEQGKEAVVGILEPGQFFGEGCLNGHRLRIATTTAIEVLLEELEHRVANSLQIIASIIMLKARAVESEETRRHLQDTHNRVISVAAVQKTLAWIGH
jgi:two-component sensor histidine kinase